MQRRQLAALAVAIGVLAIGAWCSLRLLYGRPHWSSLTAIGRSPAHQPPAGWGSADPRVNYRPWLRPARRFPDHARTESAERIRTAQSFALGGAAQPAATHDPVCGAELPAQGPLSLTYAGKVYRFCSPACRDSFRKDPKRYL